MYKFVFSFLLLSVVFILFRFFSLAIKTCETEKLVGCLNTRRNKKNIFSYLFKTKTKEKCFFRKKEAEYKIRIRTTSVKGQLKWKKHLIVFKAYNNDEDNFTYEEIEEYLKKHKIVNEDENENENEYGSGVGSGYGNGNGNEENTRNGILRLINNFPNIKNEEDFFSKYGIFSNRKKETVEHYFNQMKNEKERKQKKNYNFLNLLLSHYLKKKNWNIFTTSENYKNVENYYDYIHSVINSRDAPLTNETRSLSKQDNIFSRKGFCKFISFYLKNIKFLKYFSFFFMSTLLTCSIHFFLRKMQWEHFYYFKQSFPVIYFLKNIKLQELALFSFLTNLLFWKKYTQYFSITEEAFVILFNHYFFYKGIKNLNKENIKEFMYQFNYQLRDVLNSLNDIFSKYITNQIYVKKEFDPDVLFHVDCFISLFHVLFRNNKENIQNILRLVLNKYHIYSTADKQENKKILSKICFIFYIINIKFKYDVKDVHKLNLVRTNEFGVPFFGRTSQIDNYFLLVNIAESLNIKPKVLNEYLLDFLKNRYEKWLRLTLKEQQLSDHVFADIEKKNVFLTMDRNLIEDIHIHLFLEKAKQIMESPDYESMNLHTIDVSVSHDKGITKNEEQQYEQENKQIGEKEEKEEEEKEKEKEVKRKDTDEEEYGITMTEEQIARETAELEKAIINVNSKGDEEETEETEEIEEIEEREESEVSKNIMSFEKTGDTSDAYTNDVELPEGEIIVHEKRETDITSLYKNIEDSVHFITDKNYRGVLENRKKIELIKTEDKELLLEKIKNIFLLRNYLQVDKEFVNRFLEKYIFTYLFEEYKTLINNIVFKRMKNKNEDIFFLNKKIAVSKNTAHSMMKDIILSFVATSKENINIFFKLSNMEKCIELAENMVYVYKMLKKRKKLLEEKLKLSLQEEVFNLDEFFSFNFVYESEASIRKRKQEEKEKEEENEKGEQDAKRYSQSEEKSPIKEENLKREAVREGEREGEGERRGFYRDEMQLEETEEMEEIAEGVEQKEEEIKEKEKEIPIENMIKQYSEQEEELYIKSVGQGMSWKEVLTEETAKKIYEHFVLKHMNKKTDRTIFKLIFNLEHENVDREIENNIIRKFLEKAVTTRLNDLEEFDRKFLLLGDEKMEKVHLFDYTNVPIAQRLLEINKTGYKKERVDINTFKVKKENIFRNIDVESFEEMCKKMYINKVLELKENIYQNRKKLYFYEIVLNIKNSYKIHDTYLIDEYEKMITDIIKINILNKNYLNMKNMYLKKIKLFLNISDEHSTDVEMNCIFQQVSSIFHNIKENFYIYANNEDFIKKIKEIKAIYENCGLIKKKENTYFVKFSLIDPNTDLVQKIIERYILHVMDFINSENKIEYKESIFQLLKIFGMNKKVLDAIARKIYQKYVESQGLHEMNNMDAFFQALFDMAPEEQKTIVFSFLKKKMEEYLTANLNSLETFNKVHELTTFINAHLEMKKNIFDLSSLNTQGLYEFLIASIDAYLSRTRSEHFLASENQCVKDLTDFLTKIQFLLHGDKKEWHFSHIMNTLKTSIANNAIIFLDKFEYDKCVEEIYKLLRIYLVDKKSRFVNLPVDKRKKLVNIFSYQNIEEGKKFLYLDILNRIFF